MIFLIEVSIIKRSYLIGNARFLKDKNNYLLNQVKIATQSGLQLHHFAKLVQTNATNVLND